MQCASNAEFSRIFNQRWLVLDDVSWKTPPRYIELGGKLPVHMADGFSEVCTVHAFVYVKAH